MAVGLGLFCVIGGLFLSAGLKEALWPKSVAIGGIVILVVGLVANAILSRARPASGD
jgi:ABC-type Mn2+/Zn2+ transport system permease subunit